MAPFGGWSMPIQYAGIIDEHTHTRNAVSIFDTCHMGEFIIKGPDAARDLDRLVTCDIASLPAGRCRYGFLLNEQGCVLDDTITYRIASHEFMMVVNAGTTLRDAAWIAGRCSPGTYFEDISACTGKLDLQGPLAGDVLQPHVAGDLNTLKYFSFFKTTIAGADVLISRTGYTGEYGFELYIAAAQVAWLWELLAKDARVKPAGLGARDTLRLECGLPLYGHELSEERTPARAGLDFAMALGKEFIGKAALIESRDRPATQMLCGLTLAGRQSPRAGQAVTRSGAPAGVITSGSFAPSLGHAVALAYLAPVCAEQGTHVQIETGRAPLDATVCALPFYTKGTARRR